MTVSLCSKFFSCLHRVVVKAINAKGNRFEAYCFLYFFAIAINVYGLFASDSQIFDLPNHSSGLPWQLTKLTFSGHLGCSRSQLLINLRTKPRARYLFWKKHHLIDESFFLEDIRRIKRLLELEGYYASTIGWKWRKFEKKRKVELMWQIEAGGRFKVQDIVLKLSADSRIDQAALMELLRFRKGDDFSERLFQDSYQLLMSFFLTRGHLWVEIQPYAQISRQEKMVRIRFVIDPGPITSMGDTMIKGSGEICEELIRREFTHVKGEVFNTAKLNQSRLNILQTQWFKSVVLTPDAKAKRGSQVVPVVLDLKEAEQRSIGLGLGMGSDEGLRGKVKWQHRNWLGRGWKNTVDVQTSKLDTNVSMKIDIPRFYLMNADLSISGQYGRENEDDYTLLLGSLGVEYILAFGKGHSAEFQWQLKNQRHESDSTLLSSLNFPPESSDITGLGVKWNREWKRAGFLNALSFSWKGEGFDDIDGSRAGFWRHQMTQRSRSDLAWGWSLHQNYAMGWMSEWSNHTIPISDRFYLGGSGSVRGYARRHLGPRNLASDILGGKSFASYSFELQHSIIIKDLVGALFIDGGQLDLKSYGWQLNDFRHSVGPGLGYRMPIGLIRLDIGFPLNRNHEDAPFQIHFDFGIRL